MPPDGPTTSPLETLHRRIISRDTTIKESDIDAAVEDEIKALSRRLAADPVEMARRVERVKLFHNKLKTEKEDLIKAYDAGKLDFFKESRKMWAEVPSLETLKERPSRFDDALREARNLTDPEREGEFVIDDYEGWGPGWVTEGSNQDNETRWTLSGYLTAMELENPALRVVEFASAHEAYDSWTGSVLKYSELQEDMKMGEFLEDLRKYKILEDEPKGYLAGCLRLSQSQHKPTDPLYRKYLFKTIDKLVADGKFTISPDKSKWERGHDQINVLKSVYTPREWVEQQAETRNAFIKFSMHLTGLIATLGIVPPSDVMEFIKRPLDTITNEDSPKLADYKDLMAAYARGKLVQKKAAMDKTVAESTGKLKEVIRKNSVLKKYTDESVEQVREKFENAAKAAGALALGAGLTFDDVVSVNASLSQAESDLRAAVLTLDQMAGGLASAAVKPGEGAGGGGGAGGGAPESLPSGADVYKDKWASAELVDSRWTVSSVRVAPSLADTPYRDSSGKIAGKIPGGTPLTIVEGKARKVEGVTFVQVEYNGKKVWVDEAVLIMGEEKPAEEAKEVAPAVVKAPKKTPKKKPATKETVSGTKLNPEVKKMLGGVEAAYKYADASNEIMKYYKNPKKYPSGVTIQLPFNNTLVPAEVVYAAGGKVDIRFRSHPAKRYTYYSMESFMKRLHTGMVLWRRQYDILDNEASYRQWGKYIGALDDFERLAPYKDSKTKWTHRIEFDWPGTDPDIWVRPDPHGRIVYVIERNHAAPDGKDSRKGYCENFNALLVVMKRYLDWTEKYDDIPNSRKAVAERKERQYDKLVHPLAFRQYAKDIGRVVRLNTKKNGVGIILDWGGGNDINSVRNARLDVSVDANGDFRYRVARGKLSKTGTARSFGGVVGAVKRLRS